MPSSFPEPREFRDTLRQQMPDLPGLNEPGFASTFDYSAARQKLWDYGGLLPVGALGAALWYLNRNQQPKPLKKKKTAVLEKHAAPDLQKMLENIRWHLPKIRLPDTVAGSLAGAGAGGLYDLIRGRGKDGKRKTLKRVLTGALAGAGVSNLLGDRLRRYVSNTVIPVGNDPKIVQSLTPTPRRIWNAAILDKTDYRPEDMESFLPMAGTIPARQELVRRQFGLPAHDAKNPWWQKNPAGHYSLNEQSPDYEKRLQMLFGKWGRKSVNQLTKNTFQNPVRGIRDFNTHGADSWGGYQSTLDLLSTNQLVGGQLLPYTQTPDGAVKGMVLDRWDQTPNQAEADFLRKNWWKILTDSEWRKKRLDKPLSWYLRPSAGNTNEQAAKVLAGRMAWDNLLSDELPWVGQKFQFTKNPTPWIKRDLGSSAYQLSFLRDDGTPATQAMDINDFQRWNNAPGAAATPGTNAAQPLEQAMREAWRQQISQQKQ